MHTRLCADGGRGWGGQDVSREFGLTAPQTAVLGTLFFIGFFLGVPCFGYMGDKYGRARTLLLSAVLTQVRRGAAEPRGSTTRLNAPPRRAYCVTRFGSRHRRHAVADNEHTRAAQPDPSAVSVLGASVRFLHDDPSAH